MRGFYYKGLIFLLCLRGLTAVPAAEHVEAVKLNEKGFELYSQQKYGEALSLFEQAQEADPSYVYAQYNYACTAAILIRLQPERRNELAASAYAALEKSVHLRSSYRDKMLADPDLSVLQDDYRFYHIAGFDPSGLQDARYLLQNLRWNAQDSLLWTGMDFYSDGSLVLHTARADLAGSYRVSSGGRIRIEVPDAGFNPLPVEGIIGENGLLSFSLPGMLFVSGSRAAD